MIKKILDIRIMERRNTIKQRKLWLKSFQFDVWEEMTVNVKCLKTGWAHIELAGWVKCKCWSWPRRNGIVEAIGLADSYSPGWLMEPGAQQWSWKDQSINQLASWQKIYRQLLFNLIYHFVPFQAAHVWIFIFYDVKPSLFWTAAQTEADVWRCDKLFHCFLSFVGDQTWRWICGEGSHSLQPDTGRAYEGTVDEELQ